MKSIVVTGAGSGVGRAAALACLDAGWGVALLGRRAEALEETLGQSQHPANGLVLSCDVTDPDAVEAAFNATVSRFGRVDALFNNAGSGSPPATIDETAIETWRNVVDVDLNGSDAALGRQKIFVVGVAAGRSTTAAADVFDVSEDGSRTTRRGRSSQASEASE